MSRIYLGELEELILLIVAMLQGEAYGVAVQTEVKEQTGRAVNISAIHAALRRLEAKGYLRSEWGDATAQRGGRRKRLFVVTQGGVHALQTLRDMRVQLWNQIPGLSPNLSIS
ncbi:Transcriptional regulator PadR-like family protein [Catalinimonas alkaloidigena]|uniref:Transcriptional regulator PadR-like family protein n=1 Tax=Catalinimonas alkaloidigena TaxID=1075417 RepID=A0A1G9N2M3_9BACT|nr:PadR family transcriptional regulator [Catalinimonas alkaloidigena]SDL80511.1 Transcriptional regulator PadR-like family protein [Catalinimonas alkaloidigena]